VSSPAVVVSNTSGAAGPWSSFASACFWDMPLCIVLALLGRVTSWAEASWCSVREKDLVDRRGLGRLDALEALEEEWEAMKPLLRLLIISGQRVVSRAPTGASM
jgi:hypothetical protein